MEVLDLCAVGVDGERGEAVALSGGRLPGWCLVTHAGGTRCGHVGGAGARECTVMSSGGGWLRMVARCAWVIETGWV